MRRPAFTIAVLRGLVRLCNTASDEIFLSRDQEDMLQEFGQQGLRDMDRASEWLLQMQSYMNHRKNKKSAEEVKP